jgi:hypothetical protein
VNAIVRLPGRAELLSAAAGAAALAAALVWLGPPGTDLAAHVYQRTLWAQHGFVLWNNFWYAGRYSFVTYSLAYYPLAVLLGIKLLAVLSVATSVAAFAAVVHHEWGAQSRWAIRVFAVVWAALVLSGAYPFMLGCAFALLAIWTLQHGRRGWFGVAALLALAASPLAFLLLVVVLAGLAFARRHEASTFVAPIVAIGAMSVFELVLQRMFPSRGRFPFSPEEFAPAVVFCTLGIALTWRVARAWALRWMFVAYLTACTVAFAVSSPIGENIARLRFLAAPLAVLTVSLRDWRPRIVCVAVVALATSWNVTPLAASFIHSTDDPASRAAYWTPATRFLDRHLAPGYRVEAVDTRNHWPAYFLARARIPLVRGWFRQEDFPLNRLLYDELGARKYVDWLRALSVQYVVLTKSSPDYSSRAEALLLRGGRTRLPVVFSTRNVQIFRVPSPQPLVSPPARVLALGYETLRLSVPRPGTYRIGVAYTPYWQSRAGCLERTSTGMTRLVAHRAGIVTLRFAVTPSRALETLAGESEKCGASGG